jgi:hypothetical protein
MTAELKMHVTEVDGKLRRVYSVEIDDAAVNDLMALHGVDALSEILTIMMDERKRQLAAESQDK